jgi:uncharacterized Zn-finger protein
MGPFETIYIDETVAACDGGALDHPRVYLKLDHTGKVECPYCSRLFVNRAMQGSDEPAPAKAGGEATTLPSASEPRNV